jgi:hypothetical protein
LDYGSAKEACENFARPNENNSGSREESWEETCGHCKTTRIEELCEVYGSARSVEEKNEEDENEQEMVPSFTVTYEALEKVKAFFYAQSVSENGRK